MSEQANSQNKVDDFLSLRYLFRLALPIMVGGFIQFVVNFTDTAFVGRLGETALNAVGNGGLIFITLFVVGQGLASGVQILVARRKTELHLKQVGMICRHSLFLSVLFALVLFGSCAMICRWGLALTIHDPGIASGMNDYLQYRMPSFFFVIPNAVILGYYSGIGKTGILAWSAGITAIVNIVLDYALIYGHFGLPAMEIRGAALASTLAEGFSFIFVLIYIFKDPFSKTVHLNSRFKPRKKLFKKILRLSWPLIAQRFVSLFAWSAFFFFIEKTGSQNLAVSQIVRSLYFLAFIPILGFGNAAATVVSQLMAIKDFHGVKKGMIKMAWVSSLTTLVFIHGYLFYPKPIIALITEDPELIARSVPVLQLIVASMLLHSLVMVLFNAVSGVGDTKWAFIIELTTIIIYLSYCYWVCIINPQDLFVIWSAEFLYFGLLACLSLAYFRWSKWHNYII